MEGSALTHTITEIKALEIVLIVYNCALFVANACIDFKDNKDNNNNFYYYDSHIYNFTSRIDIQIKLKMLDKNNSVNLQVA